MPARRDAPWLAVPLGVPLQVVVVLAELPALRRALVVHPFRVLARVLGRTRRRSPSASKHLPKKPSRKRHADA
jgi:hypothetical protein